MRPPRPSGSPDAAASDGPMIPPPQMTQWLRISVPSARVTRPGATSVTATPMCRRTPLRPSTLLA